MPELIDELREAAATAGSSSGSTQRGRAEAEPEEVPGAIAYYRRLERAARSPTASRRTREGAEPVAVQLRLVVRLLPAGVPAARAADDDLPPRPLRSVSAPYPDRQRHDTAVTATDHAQLARAIELARAAWGGSPRTRSSARSSCATARSSARAGTTSYGGPHAEVNAIARRRRRRARRDALRLARAVLPRGQDAAVHRRDRRGGHRARRRRLRRPDREGLAAAASGSCATRASRSTSPTASSPPARGCSTRPSASTRAPAARGCSSSRR